MSSLTALAHAVNLVAVLCAVAVLLRGGRSRTSPAARWALAMFCDLGAVVLLAFFPVHDDGSLLRHGYTVVLVGVLLLVPYLLVRIALSLGAVGSGGHRVAATLTVVQLAFTAAAPRFPEPGEPRTGWFTAFVVLTLVGWTVQSVLSAAGLWTAGRGQPAIVRRRMRALSLGAVVLAVALVAGSTSGQPSTAVQVVSTLVGVLGVCLLVLAFVVPPWLAAAWRAADLVRLGSAERRLMAAVTPAQVATALVPAVVQLFGAAGAALIDAHGRAIGVQGVSEDVLAGLHHELDEGDAEQVVVLTARGGVACRLSDGWLVVQPGVFAPLFGAPELHLLDRVGSFADLALARCQLFEEEARSRRSAEAASAELQTLIYTVSHDLRNPIISVLGYLDVLAREHAGELRGDGEHYLTRISVNAQYMQSLIQSLLELSRIGRSEPPPQAVALGALAESVAEEMRVLNPQGRVTVEGPFPVAWMSELRARQLLTNLIDNAAKYGPGDVQVTVRAVPDDSGGAVVTIADNGRGIPPQHREKAFDVFERLDAAQGDIAGTGMGLPICKRITDTLGGSITLGGPPADQSAGTTVRITLPASVVLGWAPVCARAEGDVPMTSVRTT